MTQLELAMDIIKKTFDTYAALDGDSKTLNNCEAKKLLEAELPKVMKMAKNQEGVTCLLNSLDTDGDKAVNFREFMTLISAMMCTFHNCK